jgi:para-nitrobenzyl esterase
VIVWIHGGSDAVGRGGSEPASLARLGVVVVTFNYRLGILGFLAHPALTRESPHGASGNYGLLDQIEALRWVHRNIEAFGGDPDRVMVAGHSAGGGAVLQLLVTPLARGLFQRAVAQSGTLDMSQPLADAEAEGIALAHQLGVPADDPLPALRAAPIESLLAITARGYQGTTDGWVLPSSAPSLLQAGRMDAMPLIIGATANEAAIFGFTPPARRVDYRELVRRDDPAPERLLAHYPAPTDDDVPAAVRRYITDRDFVCPARYVAATRPGPTWLYLYAAPAAPGARIGAFHGAELRPQFAQEFGAPLGAMEQRIGDAMRRYWVQFARAGDPNVAGLPAWPVYQRARPRVLELGDPVRVTEGLGRDGCDVFDEVWTRGGGGP